MAFGAWLAVAHGLPKSQAGLDAVVVATAGEAVTALPADYAPDTVQALIISPAGESTVAELIPRMGTYQRIIGAYVAIYYPDLRWHVYCHEATSLNVVTDVPSNTIATDLAQWADPSFKRIIRGTAVIVGTGRTGQDLDVPADVLRRMRGEL